MLGVKGGCAGKDTPKCGFLCEAEQLAMKDTSRRCFACHRNQQHRDICRCNQKNDVNFNPRALVVVIVEGK